MGRGLDYTDTTDMENLYITRLIKNGTSLAIIIPKDILKAVGLQRGDLVVFKDYGVNQFSVRWLTGKEIKEIKDRPAVKF